MAMKSYPLTHSPLPKSIPAFGLGTWKSDPGVVGQAVEHALEAGYRHIDCAAIYGNEKEIGDAMKNSSVPRDDLFLTSKLWNAFHAPDDVEPALRKTLADLQIDCLDLYLMHWPVAAKTDPDSGESSLVSLDELPIIDTWHAMEVCVVKGLVKSIGVSNFSVKKLKDLMVEARIKPAVNQVEMHPYLQQQALVDYCNETGIVVTAYSPLGSNDRPEAVRSKEMVPILEDETVASIAKAHGSDVSPAQVLLAWGMQRGTVVIPKSVSEARQKENLASTELTLTDEEMASMAKLDKAARYIDASFFCGEGSPYTVGGIWDE